MTCALKSHTAAESQPPLTHPSLVSQLPQVWFTAVSDPNARTGHLAATIKAPNAALGERLRIAAIHVLGVAPDHEVARQLRHQDAVYDVVSEAIAKTSDSNMRKGHAGYDAKTYDVVNAALDEAARLGEAPPFATVNGAKLPGRWVKYSQTRRMIQITGLDLAVSAPLEISWSLD